MYKFYTNGADFLTENAEFLNVNKYLTMFFFTDAPLLESADNDNYAVSVTSGGKHLVALKVQPYNLLVYGDGELADELIDAIVTKKCNVGNFMGSEQTCEYVVKAMERYGKTYYEALAMDFMAAKAVTEPSSDGVAVATENDVAEILEHLQCFVKDCGLTDEPTEKGVRKYLDCYLVYRIDGKIVSMAMASNGTENAKHITAVYTLPEYRNRGYARKVVNTLKNQIITSGKVATLNVDKTNPYSNKLYASIGFEKLFSHGEYRLK